MDRLGRGLTLEQSRVTVRDRMAWRRVVSTLVALIGREGYSCISRSLDFALKSEGICLAKTSGVDLHFGWCFRGPCTWGMRNSFLVELNSMQLGTGDSK